MSKPKELAVTVNSELENMIFKHNPDIGNWPRDVEIKFIEYQAYDKEHEWRLQAEQIYFDKAEAYDKLAEHDKEFTERCAHLSLEVNRLESRLGKAIEALKLIGYKTEELVHASVDHKGEIDDHWLEKTSLWLDLKIEQTLKELGELDE